MLCLVFVFFFKDTATTEIYTYLHTLSLHDSLPIQRVTGSNPVGRAISTHDCSDSASAYAGCRPSGAPFWCKRYRQRMRSEEHTSELQSLMRISYAVFCLKKKTHTNNSCTAHTTVTQT